MRRAAGAGMKEGFQQEGLAWYEIRVKGCVHPASGWFDGMTVTPLDGGETLIAGAVADQAALHGLLIRIRDMNLVLLCAKRVDWDKE